MKDLDRVTIVAISALAYALANVVHEGLGHGGACLLLGARPTMFNAIFFNYDEATASDTAQRLISAAGSIVIANDFPVGERPPLDRLGDNSRAMVGGPEVSSTASQRRPSRAERSWVRSPRSRSTSGKR